MIIRILKRFGKSKLLLLSGDLFLLIMAVTIIFFIRYSFSNFQNFLDSLVNKYILFLIIIFLVIIPLLRYFDAYKYRIYSTKFLQSVRIFKSLLFSFLFLAIVTFFIKTESITNHLQTNATIFFSASFFFLLIWRIWIFRNVFIKSESFADFLNKRCIIIGAGEAGEKIARKLSSNSHPYTVIGFLDDDILKQGLNIDKWYVMGTIEELEDIVIQHQIDEIFLSIHKLDNSSLLKLIGKSNNLNIPIRITNPLWHIIDLKGWQNEYEDMSGIQISGMEKNIYRDFFKGCYDVAFSGFLLILLSPLFVLCALIIKLSSRGPVLYKTTVIGKNAKPFIWYKFRSMYHNNSPDIHTKHLQELIKKNKPVEKLHNDSRVTPFGRFIRKYSIDELPQLYNVLIGDMSFFGPRPCLEYEYESMKIWHRQRFSINPGISGIGQISSRNSKDVTFNDSIILDIFYSENVSFWLDLQIFIKTIPIILFGRGGV